MRGIILTVLCTCASLVAACERAEENAAQALPDQSGDTIQAEDSGAVEMAEYYMVLLRRGPTWTAEMTPEVEEVLAGHFANMERLEKEGVLALAGPFGGTAGEGSLTGMFLFRAASLEEAQALADSDPGVQAGRFTTEIVQWYGPKSLTY